MAWKQVKVGKLGKIVTGKTPKTADRDNYNGQIMFVTPSDNMDDKYIYSTGKTITEKGKNSVKGSIIPAGSVCVSCIGSDLGKAVITTEECVTNQQINSVIVDREKYDVDFVYYAMLVLGKELNFNSKTSTAVPIVNKSSFSSYEISCPSLNVQKKIASVLSALDSKIEKNMEINDNLEQQLAALFINDFADDIAVASTDTCPMLGDLITVIDNRGKTPPLTTETFDYPIIDVGALKGSGRIVDFNNCTKYVEQSTYEHWFRSGHPQPWDILISTVGSLAEMKIYLGSKGCMAQNVVALRAVSISPLYLYQYLRFIRADLVAYNIGSVQPSIKVTHIIKHPIFVPDSSKLENFEETAKAITNQLYANCNENESLKKLRNTLLPRLMSGELDVSELDI